MVKRLIIDTNLLLLLVIGAVEEGRHIRNSKRLGAFEVRDYDNIIEIIRSHDEAYITPYIATEVSNLIDLDGHARESANEIAKLLFCESFKPINVEIAEDCKSPFFSSFGITDSSLIALAKNYKILTCDHRLLTPLFESGPENIIPYYTSRQICA